MKSVITFGALRSPKVSTQLKDRISASDGRRLDKLVDAFWLLKVHGMLSSAEVGKVAKRLGKECEAAAQKEGAQ